MLVFLLSILYLLYQNLLTNIWMERQLLPFLYIQPLQTVPHYNVLQFFFKYTIDKVQLIVPMYNKTTCILKMCNNNTEVIIN